MAEQTVVHISENSPERIAYILMETIANVEQKALYSNPSSDRTSADRQWILDTYAECLRAVHGTRK